MMLPNLQMSSICNSGASMLCMAFAAMFGLKALYNIGHFLFTSFIGPRFQLGINVKNCGPWAVITGATDGIGKAYAKALACKGLNVVLIGRNQEKLSKVEKEIQESCKESVKIKTIVADFVHGRSIYDKLKSDLDQLEIGLLVNNVGMSFPIGEFHKKTDNEERISDMINCNTISMARMCRLILPQMTERRQGVIINVGSISSAFPFPLLTLYAATKAFVDKFSQDLSAEMRRYGITVQTVLPGYVETNMTSKIPKPTMSSIDPDTFVKYALSTLGLESRTAGFWMHKAMLYWLELAAFLVPRVLFEKAVMYIVLHLEQDVTIGSAKDVTEAFTEAFTEEPKEEFQEEIKNVPSEETPDQPQEELHEPFEQLTRAQ